MENSKIEILYDVISGVVGKIQGVTQISGIIDSNYGKWHKCMHWRNPKG